MKEQEREKKGKYSFQNKKTNQNTTFRPKIIYQVFSYFESTFMHNICLHVKPTENALKIPGPKIWSPDKGNILTKVKS